MALDIITMDSSLQLRFDIGEDEDGKVITRTRTFNRINPDAADEDLYEMAKAIAGLQEHVVSRIVKNAPVIFEEA